MAKEYTVGADGLTVPASAVTLLFLNPMAAPAPDIQIIRLWASQAGTNTSGMVRVEVETQLSSFPTLTSATPRQLKKGDTVASLISGNTTGAAGTCGVNASVEGGGTKTTMWGDNFNNLNGYLWVPTPREIISMPAGFASGIGLYIPSTAGYTLVATGMNYAEGL
jgi:hypothetical protein